MLKGFWTDRLLGALDDRLPHLFGVVKNTKIIVIASVFRQGLNQAVGQLVEPGNQIVRSRHAKLVLELIALVRIWRDQIL